MARINPSLTYSQPNTDLFIRRMKADNKKWEVVSGRFEGKGKEDKTFITDEVLASNIESGKLARAKADEIFAERKAQVANG